MQEAFYQKHLDRVSRSFAFCIARLENPLRRWVALTYLVCRILDTIEDAAWPSVKAQALHYGRFEALLTGARHDEDPGWGQQFPPDVSEPERQLLNDANLIFADFHHFPKEVKTIIQDTVGAMTAGMKHFCARKQAGQLRLRDLQEVNQYCFFVAGIVGEALNRFLGLVLKSTCAPALLEAHHFGLFLQKINLLKDQLTDQKAGRFLIPDDVQVYDSLHANAQHAFHYIQNIPSQKRDYRLFCAWSFFLGLASLPYIRRSSERGKISKIPRWKTLRLIHEVEDRIDKEDQLELFYRKKMQTAGLVVSEKSPDRLAAPSGVDHGQQELQWLRRLYTNSVSGRHLLELGLLPPTSCSTA